MPRHLPALTAGSARNIQRGNGWMLDEQVQCLKPFGLGVRLGTNLVPIAPNYSKVSQGYKTLWVHQGDSRCKPIQGDKHVWGCSTRIQKDPTKCTWGPRPRNINQVPEFGSGCLWEVCTFSAQQPKGASKNLHLNKLWAALHNPAQYSSYLLFLRTGSPAAAFS